jgi:hypothetical protein
LIIGASLIALSFVGGYLLGLQSPAPEAQAGPQAEESQTSGLEGSPNASPTQVKPHGLSRDPSSLAPLPPNHPTIPQVDHNGHPTFDCSAIIRALPTPDEEDVLTLSRLHQDRAKLSGKPISARALVVNVYPKIMGTNWYHLCDAPGGQVFVVSSSQVAPRGSVVRVEGELKLNHEVGGVYTFPLFVEGAKLEGRDVKDAPEETQTPRGVMKL